MLKLTKLKSKPVLFLVIVLSIVGGLIYFKRTKSASTSTDQIIIHPEIKDITQTLELSGQVKARKHAQLHFATNGLVTYYPWQEGDYIKKYQTIASLDQRQLKKTLQQKLNLYAKQRNSFDQTQDDYEKNIDDGDIDLELRRILNNAQYDLDNAVLNVELQDLSLQYSRLYAPFDGILTSSSITSPNVHILPTDIFTLVDPDSLYFSAELEEGDLNLFKSDIPVEIVLDAFPDQAFTGHIKQLAFSAKQTTTGTVYPLEIDFDKQVLSTLRLDLSGTAYLILAKHAQVLSLPQEAIHEDKSGTYVLCLKDSPKPQHCLVELGLEGSENVEIKSGLSKDDRVIVGE